MRQAIIGRKLPVSREATIKLRKPSQHMAMVGTPRECCMKFMDAKLVGIDYKYPWMRRQWYTFLARRGKWKGVDGNISGSR